MYLIYSIIFGFLSFSLARTPHYNLVDDMLLTPEQMETLDANMDNRNAMRWSESYWPKSTFIYSFHESFPESDMHLVEQAMKNISDQTCIKFRRTYDLNRKQCIIRRSTSGCYSSVGYPLRSYKHSHMNLAKGCMVQKGILHELLHALAFFHMHQVPDRDEYVKIVYENIKKNFWSSFAKVGIVKNLGVPYDIRSLMHYNPRDFSANGKRTIESRIKGIDAVGGAKGMSQLDVEKLNRLYCRLYDSF